MQYQWENLEDAQPTQQLSTYQSKYGPVVLERDTQGVATKIRFQALIDNPRTSIYLVGAFNAWGKENLNDFELLHDEHSMFAHIDIDATKHTISHKSVYKLLVYMEGKRLFMQDPAAAYFDDDGNSVFWDFADPTCYQLKEPFIDTFHRSTRILQTDLPGLLVHWKSKDGRMGKDISTKQYFSFIAQSGILDHIASLGFNTIQFLPFAQSIDGDNWKFRYLVPFQFAIQKNWGNPDEFAAMIDACHRLGIAVIGDFVLGHMPFKDYSVFGKDGEVDGIQLWENRHHTRLFMKEETSWGTMRIDYDNTAVQDFLIASCVHFQQRYRVDGFRIDNVDGILRYGANGDGDERPQGRAFLRRLHKTLYAYNPHSLIHLESHYFHEDNAKMLVIPFDQDQRSLGATAYNSSRLTYFFHKHFMLKSADQISAWAFRNIVDEKEWGQSNATVADFHNHDAAAGLMDMRCTGSYAYDAMTVKRPQNHIHALGKIKVMEAIIAFGCEGRTLDLLQTFLLQTGTFEHDSSIQWFLTFNQCNHNMVSYKKRVNLLMEDPAFWPTGKRSFLSVDDSNKVLVLERTSASSRYVIVINLSSWIHYDYAVGVTTANPYEVVLNSDLFDYSGLGLIRYPDELTPHKSTNFELLDKELTLSLLPGYGVVVLKEKL